MGSFPSLFVISHILLLLPVGSTNSKMSTQCPILETNKDNKPPGVVRIVVGVVPWEREEVLEVLPSRR